MDYGRVADDRRHQRPGASAEAGLRLALQWLRLLLRGGALRHRPRTHPQPSGEGACVALQREGDHFVCGMIRRPGPYMQLPNAWADAHLGGIFAEALRAGKGCDADDPEPSLTPRA
jgi:hypothetical protein